MRKLPKKQVSGDGDIVDNGNGGDFGDVDSGGSDVLVMTYLYICLTQKALTTPQEKKNV